MRIELSELGSPLGLLLLAHGPRGLAGLEFADVQERLQRHLARHFPGSALERGVAPRVVAEALQRYFAGALETLRELATDPRGSPFQLRVWRALGRLRAGETLSYTELAGRLGRPRAVRAVGAANAANPLAIVIPCHRVLGSDGALRGYGGGLDRKRWLLEHEAGRLPSARAARGG